MEVFSKHYHPPGTAPGTLVAVPSEVPLRIDLVDLSPGQIEEKRLATVAECHPYLKQPTTTWIHIQGNAPPETLHELAGLLDLHLLALEDVTNLGQRAKLEEYDQQLFVVMHLPRMNAKGRLIVDQVSLFLGEGFLLSFCGAEADPFDLVRERLRRRVEPIGQRKSDFLLYALLDSLVDEAFPLLEGYGERIEALENELLERPNQRTLARIHRVRRDLLLLRRGLWPQREVLSQLYRGECTCIAPDTRIFLRDCYDHTVQIVDLIESYREMTSSMTEVYLSTVSNRLNESMRVLTVIATLFMPLSFIAGVYGMNFEHMPELHWDYGYPAVWLLIIAVSAGMIYLFRRNKWF